MRNQFFDAGFFHALGFEFGADFVGGFAAHEGFGLGEDVGEQDFVVAAQVAAFFKRGDEVDRGDVGTLVQQLEEGVLTVDAGFAPNNRGGFVADGLAVEGNLFAVALHVELLDEFGQAVEVLVVGGDDVAAAAVVVDVPDADEGENDGEVALERGVDEVLVHQVRAVEQFDEVFFTQVEHDGQADCRPEAVSSADPVPKFKHIGGVDTEFGDGFLVGGDGDEVFGDSGFIACVVKEPFARGQGVGEGFLGGEGFGGDDEEGGLGVDFGQYVAQLGAVHVGDEVHVEAGVSEGFERGTHHQRAEVGAADADIDDVGDDLVGVAQPVAAADFVCEFAHALQDAVDFGHDVFAVNDDGGIGAVAQGDVEDGAVFGGVDFFAVEHLLHTLGYAGFASKLGQQGHGFVADAVFGVIQRQPADLQPVAFRTLRVLLEHFAHVLFFGFVKMYP